MLVIKVIGELELMASTKELFTNGIAFIKRELQDYSEELAEYEEALGYMSMLPLYKRQRVAHRIAEFNIAIEKLRNQIRQAKADLKYFQKEYSYSDSEINAIMPASDELLEATLIADEKDIIRDSKKYEKEKACMLQRLAMEVVTA